MLQQFFLKESLEKNRNLNVTAEKARFGSSRSLLMMTFVYRSIVLFFLCPCRTAPSPRAVRPPGCPRWSWRRGGCAPAGWTTPPPSTPLVQTPQPSARVVTKMKNHVSQDKNKNNNNIC
jgi:hypothetical protein